MIVLSNQETVVRVNKGSSINPIQSGETESRARAIYTALAPCQSCKVGILRFIDVINLDVATNKIARTN